MRTKLVLAAIIVLVFTASYLAKAHLARRPLDEIRDAQPPRRIVSMAPSITETLFALGLGDRVVGVTQYCRYPAEANKKTRVGGYLNPNFEAIVALKPDLVVALESQGQPWSAFDKLRLRAPLRVCHKNVEGVLDSVRIIGRACGAEAKAREIVTDIESRIERIRQKTAGLERPRVMLAIQGTVKDGRLEDLCIAGSDGFFDRIIALAGGQNACPPSPVRFPVVSAESVLWMNPQVIIDMTPGLNTEPRGEKTVLADWRHVAEVEAVTRGRVHVVVQDYAFVPGPRFILLVEDLARFIHPEIDWE